MDVRRLAQRGVLPRIQQLQDEINAREAEITKLVDGRGSVRRVATMPVHSKKQKHWTQTPAGKAKLSASLKRSWKTRRAAAKASADTK